MSWNIKKHIKGVLAKESGTVTKEHGGKRTFVLIYPNTYFVGMSNLGIHNIYRLLNEQEDIVCERAFLPEKKEFAEYKRTNTPILTIESQRPVGEFDNIIFSVAFENDIENIKPILELSKIEAGDPRLVAGGAAVTLNPELFKDIFANIVTGDFETSCHPCARGGLSSLPTACRDDIALARNVIWTQATEFGNMHLVEMQRGCPNRCKFCAAPVIYEPFRQFSMEAIINAIDVGLPHRKKIGLIGGDILAHPHFIEIAEYIHSKGGIFSPSSIRADRVTDKIAELLKQSGHKTITLAPEAGSETLRRQIGKPITDLKFFQTADCLFKHGINRIKLYFIIGLPNETEGDICNLINFAKEFKKHTSLLTIAINPFVPKKGTAFEGSQFAGVAPLKERLKAIRKGLSPIKGIGLKFESPLSALREYRHQT